MKELKNLELLAEAVMAQAISDLGSLLRLEEAGFGNAVIGRDITRLPGLKGTVHDARVRVEEEIRSMLDRWCPNVDTDAMLEVAKRTAREKADTNVVYTALGWATVSGRS